MLDLAPKGKDILDEFHFKVEFILTLRSGEGISIRTVGP